MSIEPVRKVRLLRGQVVVREEPDRPSVFWTPEQKQRQVKTHCGRVLGMGAPALEKGVEQAQDFKVGDLVQFHFSRHNREAHTRIWPEDDMPALWIPHGDIDAVWYEPSHDS